MTRIADFTPAPSAALLDQTCWTWPGGFASCRCSRRPASRLAGLPLFSNLPASLIPYAWGKPAPIAVRHAKKVAVLWTAQSPLDALVTFSNVKHTKSFRHHQAGGDGPHERDGNRNPSQLHVAAPRLVADGPVDRVFQDLFFGLSGGSGRAGRPNFRSLR
jgi:hypothetical protein